MPTQTVLVVEDDEVIRSALEQILQYQGYQTFTAIHGQDALEKLKGLLPATLLIMDLMMPVMNGWELLAALRKDDRWKTLPVIILSAGSDAPSGPQSDPFVRFLKKPLRMQTLLSVVAEIYAARS
ncbi:response regulator [Bdellovibrionota bacterium FG-1]